MPLFESELRSVLKDRESGSRAIALEIATLLTSDSLPRSLSRTHFIDLARFILSGTRAFALVFDLLHHLGTTLFASPHAEEVEGVRFRAAVESWRTDWAAAQHAATGHAIARIEQGMTLATLSNSGGVRDVLVAAAEHGLRLRVMVAESHPGGEGIKFANALKSSPHRVSLLPDPVLLGELDQADRVVLGADAVFADAVLNKVGSVALAGEARRLDRELWVIAETQKWVPRAWGVATGPGDPEKDPGREGAGADARLSLFESVPAQLVTLVVSERGSEPTLSVAPQVDRKSVFRPLLSP